ncbi:hypothetical protein BGZ94_010175 [Podila epigama]|nr:hypothetical protein BGZ94_010175 [Podila epigama]
MAVMLESFKLLRVIGRGSFGKVRMVERRETGKVYALKYISKAQVIKMDAVRNVLREREILETLDHAFVVNMRFAFQDDEYMYMCMDLMMGGDLRFHLNRKLFGEDVVRFWIAELCSAVTHLHSLGIVHRDIKPDNVLLDEKGHAHLTDFNIGCKLTPEKPYLTSQSGTIAYMAPEVFKTPVGYGTSVDWWALGVVFYECIYSKRPFQTDNLNDLKRAIPTQHIDFPQKDGLSRECISAMQGFLTRDINERLGIRGGMDAIRQHPFFQAGTYQSNPENWWYMLETKQLTPKFQPSSEHNNFDATFDLEELLLDDEPLTYRSTRKRAQRMQKEKNKALKEENARAKAEHEANVAAAELAMTSMGLSNEEYYNYSQQQQQQKHQQHQQYHQQQHRFQQQQQQQQQQYQQQYQQYPGTTANASYNSPPNLTGSGGSTAQALPHMLPRSDKAPISGDQRINKKKSKVYLTKNQTTPESGAATSDSNSSSTNSSHVHLASAPTESMPSSQSQLYQQQQQSSWGQNASTRSEPAHGWQSTSTPPPPPLQFPTPPPPSATRQSRHQQPNMFAGVNNRHLASLPPPPTHGLPAQPTMGSQEKSPQLHGYTTIAAASSLPTPSTMASAVAGNGGGSGGQGATPIYLSKPATTSMDGMYSSSYKGSAGVPGGATAKPGVRSQHPADDDHAATKNFYQAYQTPRAVPTRNVPLNDNRSQHQPQQPHSMHPYNQASPQRHGSPSLNPVRGGGGGGPGSGPANVAAASAAAKEAMLAAMASGNLSKKDKIAYQMALIDREFKTFDYTVYENYNGLVDPVTMSVGDPPEWVRSRDDQ